MAKYTISIREILQMGNDSVDQIEPAVMTNLAKRYLFGSELNVISGEYRDFLATAFAYHYFLDEIGQETFGLWRMRLISKIYENQNYINEILKYHLQGIFTEYTVTHNTGNKRDVGVINKEINRESNGKADNTQKTDGNQTSQSQDTGLRTDNLKDTTTYGSASEDKGTIANQDSGSDIRRNTGTTEQAHSGYDTSYSQGYATESHTGYDETVVDQTDSNKSNSVQLFSDTPMGALGNLITAIQSDATGTGVSRATTPGTDFEYLSTATENDATNVDKSDGTTRENYNSENRTDNNLEDKDVYNSQQTQTDNISDTTTYGRGQSETRNLVSSRSGSDSDVHTGTVQNNETQNGSATDHSEGTAHSESRTEDAITEAGNTDSTRTSSAESDKMRVTYDLLLRGCNLMGKIWDIFDPLFMGIF